VPRRGPGGATLVLTRLPQGVCLLVADDRLASEDEDGPEQDGRGEDDPRADDGEAGERAGHDAEHEEHRSEQGSASRGRRTARVERLTHGKRL
jgi:hypothetical protein